LVFDKKGLGLKYQEISIIIENKRIKYVDFICRFSIKINLENATYYEEYYYLFSVQNKYLAKIIYSSLDLIKTP